MKNITIALISVINFFSQIVNLILLSESHPIICILIGIVSILLTITITKDAAVAAVAAAAVAAVAAVAAAVAVAAAAVAAVAAVAAAVAVAAAQNVSEEHDQESYSHTHTCPNCTAYNELHIPVGKSIQEFLRVKKCDRCKCPLTKKSPRGKKR